MQKSKHDLNKNIIHYLNDKKIENAFQKNNAQILKTNIQNLRVFKTSISQRFNLKAKSKNR